MNTNAAADTIIAQIGTGNRMACGWRNASFSETSDDNQVMVTATVGRGNKNFIQVILNYDDTYTIVRMKLATKGIEIKQNVSGISASDLGNRIYHMVNK